MSNIKNGGLDQYGAEPFEQQQFGTAGVEGVKTKMPVSNNNNNSVILQRFNAVLFGESFLAASDDLDM